MISSLRVIISNRTCYQSFTRFNLIRHYGKTSYCCQKFHPYSLGSNLTKRKWDSLHSAKSNIYKYSTLCQPKTLNFVENNGLRKFKLYQNTSILFKKHSFFPLYNHERTFSMESYYRFFSPDFVPIKYSYEFLTYIHTLTGSPWWASILVGTCLLRSFITFPLAVYSLYIIAKVELLQPEIRRLSHCLKIETAKAVREFGWELNHARIKYNHSLKKLIRDLYIRDNCHPLKATLLVWIQIPMWFSLSFALRYMSDFTPGLNQENHLFHPELETEGMLWFSNMLLPDSTWILPIALGLVNLSIIEMYALQMKNTSKFSKVITNLIRCLSIVMIPIGASVPSCMCWYWTCSSLYGLLQNIVLKFPKVKRTLKIPETPSETKQPLQDLFAAAKKKYTWKK
ncbi:cytochrome c oxidase assembly protein COX18, mitochondrial [Octopus bimaculoides]|uniref:Membrane insertase YidC/Oxa/ALB C-terminal domain-containing protein n=1 Tax=Octopus bimaculoides TaxID=37653 RepID=A0A0L8GXA4_OCTBM|nr:cytochrome c oxidase assembly protein COX18, mitochondrial [Octopus bimaculoides]|eukprot:XP_014777236.1 PREDICTED: mitochondrial inner membrane protein COX18-like [Octopus bimaculoides]